MVASPSAEQIKDANWRYHDAAASSYDSKWGIEFGELGQDQVRSKLVKALGDEPSQPFPRALEIGAGTGYFCLNLLQSGVVEEVVATDISKGMLKTLQQNAAELDLDVTTKQTDAEELPFDDQSFDLVFGHAVLHHIPDVAKAFSEFDRVLRPGGAIAFCGEPSRYGDLLAAVPKRTALIAAPLWRRMLGAPRRSHQESTGNQDDHGAHNGLGLEWEVDVHAFAPTDLRRLAEQARFESVRVGGEELLANAAGWLARTLESTADPEGVPKRWRWFAFRSYLALQRVDSALLEPRLPAELFYNLLLSARKAD